MKKTTLQKVLKIESFTTSKRKEIKAGGGPTEHCDFCPVTQALRSCPLTTGQVQ
ncbi:hypothetical protein AB9P05_03780 [Roseivirga sp. BDSF3-8]|uniref:hypothetical protein n=1 Tax=Roseivirga sp. BDSF3-8 TaxID=3241598 RepID=UPI0035321C64